MIAPANDTIRVDSKAGVCRITLNRPKSLNALNPDMARALNQAAKAIRADDRVRVVIIAGAGDHFMAGGDVKGFKAFFEGKPDEKAIRAHFDEMLGVVHGFIADIREMPKPVVAAVRGAVAGAGVSLMLAADLVLAADDAFFTLAYSHLGTVPDAGSSYALPRTVGLKRAFEIALLGDRFDARTALAHGMVNRLVPAAQLEAEVENLAKRLADGPRVAYARTKALLNGSFSRTLKQQLDAESAAFADCAATRDFAEGVTAFVEKRSPRFIGS
ncbi:MAG: enoyl-CoA hydratase-related protein [Rhodospirillales bacterium]